MGSVFVGIIVVFWLAVMAAAVVAPLFLSRPAVDRPSRPSPVDLPTSAPNAVPVRTSRRPIAVNERIAA